MELVLGIFGSIVVSLLASELYDRGPAVARKIIRIAAARLPDSVGQRYEEEWLAHLDQCDGKLSQLLHSFECFLCVRTLGKIRVIEIVGDAESVIDLDANTGIFFLALLGSTLGQKFELPKEFKEAWTKLSGEEGDFHIAHAELMKLGKSADLVLLKKLLFEMNPQRFEKNSLTVRFNVLVPKNDLIQDDFSTHIKFDLGK